MKTPSYIFVHHSAVSWKKNPDQWKATDAYHRSKGWGGGGYNYEVSAKGTIHQFRPDGSVTAAQYQDNMNDGRALSICLDMNGDIELPTPEQKKAVADFLHEKMLIYKIPKENVFCHRKVATYKSCPGILLPNDILSYFLNPEAMDETPKLTEWATPAWEWGIEKGLISKDSEPTLEMQRTMTVLFRYDKLNASR